MMRGPMIETEAQRLLNKGIDKGRNESKKETAIRMLQDGILPIEKIAEYSGLDIAVVEQLGELRTV